VLYLYSQKPCVAMAMIVLKPVEVPKYIELNAIWATVVNNIALTGTCRPETSLRNSENGRPLSRANAYTARDPSAISEFEATVAMTAIIDASAEAPAMLPVELNMISMTGTPANDVRGQCMSRKQFVHMTSYQSQCEPLSRYRLCRSTARSAR
jgi:hypothetical protein